MTDRNRYPITDRLRRKEHPTMTTTETRVEVPATRTGPTRIHLTEAEVTDYAAQLRANPADGLLALWRRLEPKWDELESVRPGDYELDHDTGRTLAQAAADAGGILTWLNIGPATAEH